MGPWRRQSVRYALIVATVCARAPLAAAAHVAPATDAQAWQELDLVGQLPQQWTYLVSGFGRLSDHDPNPALTGAGGFLTWTQGALGASIGYLHAQVRLPSSGENLTADLPVAAVTGTLAAGVFTLSDRLRLEDLIGVPGNPWRYRDLLSITASPRGFGLFKALTISNEVFIDCHSGRLTRDRLLFGPVLTASQRVDWALQYLNQRDVGARPGRITGVALTIAVRL